MLWSDRHNTSKPAASPIPNLKVKALMSVGQTGESEETIRATRDWLEEVQPNDCDSTVITAYPGTPYFGGAVETQPGIWTYTCEKTGDRLHSVAVDYRETGKYYNGDISSYLTPERTHSQQIRSLNFIT